MGTQKNRLNEMILLSTYDIGFGWIIREILLGKELLYRDIDLFCWGFTSFSTLVQLYHGDSSLIHEPSVNRPVLG